MKFVDTNVIIKELYPLVASKLDSASINKKFYDNIGLFFNKKHSQVNDIAPYNNIYFNKDDEDRLYSAINISDTETEAILKKCFFWNLDYRPKCAKSSYIQLLFCALRYYILKKDIKKAEFTAIYICFTGKFYASIYSSMWKYPVNPAVMDYVINNMLSDKYDLKKEGTIFKAIQKLAKTWLEKYSKDIADSKITDDEFCKLIQQMRDRVKSFLKNIYAPYLEAAQNKYYQNYETDNVESDDFRLTDNDSAKAARVTEAAMGILTSQKVSIRYCNNAKDQRVSANQLKTILEDIILQDKENLPQVRRVVNILICEYLASHRSGSINSPEFFEYAITPKPNTKDKLIIEFKSTIISWLEKDAEYMRRRNTRPTANSYYRGIVAYFAQIIMQAARDL